MTYSIMVTSNLTSTREFYDCSISEFSLTGVHSWSRFPDLWSFNQHGLYWINEMKHCLLSLMNDKKEEW